MSAFIIVIYMLGVVTYFLTMRSLLIKDAFEEISMGFILMALFVGVTPLLNIMAVVFLHIGYKIVSNNMTPKDILKKILFIK